MKPLLYISDSYDGWTNLGIDEYFLDHIAPDEFLLSFYVNENAVIIGRGQNPWAECRLNDMDRDGVQLVRRITGGGAVFHDRGNLNFSYITGSRNYNVEKQLELILSAVRSLGIPCDFSGRNDLLADGRKFSGNAFCTRGGISQHHGTLLISSDLDRLQNYLNVDPRKLKTKGARSVRSRVCNLSSFIPDLSVDTMLNALVNAFTVHYGEYRLIRRCDLPESEIRPYILKHASSQWRLGKTPRFDTEIENRFTWGNVQLLLTLRGGIIDSIEAYTDSLNPSLPETLEHLLVGARYGSAPICAALLKSDDPEIRELAGYILNLDL